MTCTLCGNALPAPQAPCPTCSQAAAAPGTAPAPAPAPAYGTPPAPTYGEAPAPAPAPAPAYGTPAAPPPGHGGAPAYGPPTVPPPGYGVPQPGDWGQVPAPSTPVLSIIAFVLSAVALLFAPILFGGVAILLSSQAMRRHERPAKIALGVAIGCTVLGMLFGAVVGVLNAVMLTS